MRRTPALGRHRAAGLTLVEILITLLVVSIGLLGVAGLHSFSLRNNYDALMRSHASALASEIADRMRVNRNLVYTGAASDYDIVISDAAPAVVTGSSQAIRDVAEWLATLGEQLPNGDGRIAINQATRVVTIEVQWGERGDSVTNAATMSFVTETVI
ncbi:MAG: type IV pilus modification protein PilV [Steroidobacter sp.]